MTEIPDLMLLSFVATKVIDRAHFHAYTYVYNYIIVYIRQCDHSLARIFLSII